MTRTKKTAIFAGSSAVVLCAGALVLTKNTGDKSPVQAPVQIRVGQPASLPPVELTSPEKQVFDGMDATGQKTVTSFLAQTPGPLDNYLLKLEGIVDVANARYGEPDRESWQQALPVARVLKEGMCDCAQRNWLNQFVALGESGLAGDMENYHQQGDRKSVV